MDLFLSLVGHNLKGCNRNGKRKWKENIKKHSKKSIKAKRLNDEHLQWRKDQALNLEKLEEWYKDLVLILYPSRKNRV